MLIVIFASNQSVWEMWHISRLIKQLCSGLVTIKGCIIIWKHHLNIWGNSCFERSSMLKDAKAGKISVSFINVTNNNILCVYTMYIMILRSSTREAESFGWVDPSGLGDFFWTKPAGEQHCFFLPPFWLTSSYEQAFWSEASTLGPDWPVFTDKVNSDTY